MTVTAISDEAYMATQTTVECLSRLLLTTPDLDAFIDRAQAALAIGPVLHPSEFQQGAGKLGQVLTCAHALREARDRIRKVAER